MYQNVTPPQQNKRRLNITLVNTWRVVNAKGGTEKVFCNMANELVRRDHKVTAICLDKNEGKPGFPMDHRVHFINAFREKLPITLSKTVRKLRALSFSKRKRRAKRAVLEAEVPVCKLSKALSKSSPDVIVSFQSETTYALKKLVGDSTPIITMLHGHPNSYREKFLTPDIATAVENSAVVQVLRPEFVDALLKYLPSANVEVIPNCVPQFKESADRKAKTIMNIGRFAPEKRQTLQVKAFALIKDKFPEWTLELWGEAHVAPQYTKELEATIKECDVGDRVRICGTTNDVPSQLVRASIFSFPSEFEGFPLALTEAMAMGLPSVGWKECPAVNTLIRDGKNGLLCDDTPESLAEALSALMSDEGLRVRFGNTAKEDMKEYAPEKVWDRWENLLRSLTKSK